ncbi:uncharacterized protein PRCAT00004933001 [Priceomyces carsonii]|uniref:uncharacterized protein n=1 Tax=Priceomyces carsonii TaxID=28549 RepID=UPI002EDB3C26|nr:unnamed protein product [Priceomyces carsonii]
MILLIDSYDSFTNNLCQLISKVTAKEVVVIKNDTFDDNEYRDFFQTYLPLFEYVVVGPGPGNPSNLKDVGLISHLLKYLREEDDDKVVPFLGICLGFQCLCDAYGSSISRLENVKHGQVYDVHPVTPENDLYTSQSAIEIPSVRYHSLYVLSLGVEMRPLAYCFEPNNSDDKDSKILMAGKHKCRPYYGVQYHPESACSSDGDKLILRFDDIASKYNHKMRSEVLDPKEENEKAKSIVLELKSSHSLNLNPLFKDGPLNDNGAPKIYFKKMNFVNKVTPIDMCEFFYKNNKSSPNFVLLNSASIPSEWSIIGLPIPGRSQIVTHSVDNMLEATVLRYKSSECEKISIPESETVWNFLGDLMKKAYISKESIDSHLGKAYHSREIPFFGGFLGFVSYEEGQFIEIDKLGRLCNGNTPDLKLIFIERYMIYDHSSDDWFVFLVSKDLNDEKWVEKTRIMVETANLDGSLSLDVNSVPKSVKGLLKKEENQKFEFQLPDKKIYEEQFNECQRLLHSGDSYELCLTCQLKISLPSYIAPWDIYKILTLHRNPAPFSCFLEFEDSVLISSSPERFLSWKDHDFDENKKRVILRPVKGTVKKSPNVTLEDATRILKTPKEMGENLMIVDLIRHDLFQFLDDVVVSRLMAVEEYQTVFQLVSVIEGNLETRKSQYHGLDILCSSLPPGSMTGAPKKRSVHLLQDIESLQPTSIPGGRRGIYSGVAGYWSVTDNSDWSVVIRSLFHYRDDLSNTPDNSIWRIGAGGAITVLSEMQSEWEEMLTKLTAALQLFD